MKDHQESVGSIGKTLTKLCMEGFVEVDGERYEAISTYKPIIENKVIKVIGVLMGRLIVEITDQEFPIEGYIPTEFT